MKGGLGLRDLHLENLALLEKQCWRVISEPQSLWARLMKSIYFSGNHILRSPIGKTRS